MSGSPIPSAAIRGKAAFEFEDPGMERRKPYLQLALVICAVAVVVAALNRQRSALPPPPVEPLRTPNLEGALTESERVYRGVDFQDLKRQASDQPGYAQASHLIFHSASDETIRRGEVLAQTHCASCHGENMDKGDGVQRKLEGESFYRAGLRYNMGYKYGSFGPAVYRTIKYGTKNELMPAFDGVLNEEEILAVAHYIRSIQCNNPDHLKNR